MLGRQTLEHRVRVRRPPHLERAHHLVRSCSVEDDYAAGATNRHEARERVAKLAHVREAARVQQVVTVEQVQRRVGQSARAYADRWRFASNNSTAAAAETLSKARSP